MITLSISIIILIISLILLYLTRNTKIERKNQEEEYQLKITELKGKVTQLQEKTEKLFHNYQTDSENITNSIFKLKKQEESVKEEISQLKTEEDSVKTNIFQLKEKENNIKNELDKNLAQKKQNLDIFYEDIKTNSANAFQFYEKALDEHYELVEREYENKLKKITIQKEQVEKDLDQIKKTYEAAAAAKLREQEEEEKWSFYRIRLTDQQATDITKLNQFKSSLYDPSLVSKVIWTSYIMKPTNDMCKRVLGTSSPVCGIYKITNKATSEVYIGQSVNIADRWKAHIKSGLGIDASPTNQLYTNMQYTGVWNFTFEVLEACSKNKLNEKQRFWIEMYQSNKVGLNMTKGNK